MIKKTTRVMAHELITALKRPSFLFFSFGLPIIVMLLFAGIRIYKNISAPNPVSQVDADISADGDPWKPEGLVDQTGLIKTVPPDLPPGKLVIMNSETEAAAGIEDGSIAAYYLVPDTFLQDGEIFYTRSDFSLLSEEHREWVVRWTILYNLTGGDMTLASRVWSPTNAQVTNLSLVTGPGGGETGEGIAPGCDTPGYNCESIGFLRYLPMIFLVIFFMTILMASSLLIYGISLEKDNRVMEVLLVSVSPQELLNGKILGLGLLGLIMLGAYLISVVVVLAIGGQILSLPDTFTMPRFYFIWGVLFFVLGYTLYAALMAGAGALVPDIKSYSGASMVIASPLFIGYMGAIMLAFDPNGVITTTLSLVPFTSPVVMMWRMANGPVPIWQPATAVVLLAITAWLVVKAVARMFMARELLSGSPFRVKNYLRLLVRTPRSTS